MILIQQVFKKSNNFYNFLVFDFRLRFNHRHFNNTKQVKVKKNTLRSLTSQDECFVNIRIQ